MSTGARTAAATDVFDALWMMLPHPPGSVVALFARDGDARDGDIARSAREIRKFSHAHGDKNVYVAPNPALRVHGVRHSAADVSHWSYFLIDMDPVEKEYDAQAAMSEALLWFGEWMGMDFGSLPNGQTPILIDSGRGMQAWFRLSDVILDDDPDPLYIVKSSVTRDKDRLRAVPRALPRRVNSYWLKKLDEKLGLVHGCRVDTSVSDLPRQMRCPGTVNTKTRRRTSFFYETTHVFGGLVERMVALTPSTAIAEPEQPEIEAGQKWQMVYHHLTRMAQQYVTLGQEEPGRHKVMWHTAKKFKELGVSRQETRKALRRANKLRGPGQALPPEQIEHALDTAYGA